MRTGSIRENDGDEHKNEGLRKSNLVSEGRYKKRSQSELCRSDKVVACGKIGSVSTKCEVNCSAEVVPEEHLQKRESMAQFGRPEQSLEKLASTSIGVRKS